MRRINNLLLCVALFFLRRIHYRHPDNNRRLRERREALEHCRDCL